MMRLRSPSNLRLPADDPAPFIECILALEKPDRPAVSVSYRRELAALVLRYEEGRIALSQKTLAELKNLGLL